MRITSFLIENYRSIEKAGADNLGPLVALIGKNSSGKSNVLEGLASVFQYFDVAAGNTPGLDDYVFYKRRTPRPARFTVTLNLSPNEVAVLFPSDWIEFYAKLVASAPGATRSGPESITFVRELTYPQGNWKTIRVAWGDLPVVDNGTQATPEVFTKAVEELAEKLKVRVAGGSPKPPSVNIVEGTASAASTETVVSERLQIPYFTVPGLTTALTETSKLVKGHFKLVSVARDVRSPGVLRETIVDNAVQQALFALDQSTKVDDESALRRIERAFQRITNERLDLVQSRAFLAKTDLRIPVSQEGGGIQSSLNLTATLFTKPTESEIYGLEEPETHSHPELQRRLFEVIRGISENSQVFIATHSPIFVNRTPPSSILLTKLTRGGTKLEPSQNYEIILTELGAKPSDLLLASRILLVEGPTEEIIMPALFRGLHLDSQDVQIIQTGGKGGARGRAETLLKFSRDLAEPYVLFDHDGFEQGRKLVSEGLVNSPNLQVLSLGTIEDYYPRDLVEKAVSQLDEDYELAIRESKAWKDWQEGKVALASFNLGRKSLALGGGWKVVLARAMAPLLEADPSRVPEELSRFLQRVASAEERTG